MEKYCDTSGREFKNLLFDSFCKEEDWHYVKWEKILFLHA